MNKREEILAKREGARTMYGCIFPNRRDVDPILTTLFPLPTRTVPTVRKGRSNRWLRVGEVRWLPDCSWFNVMSYSSLDAARAGIDGEHGWHPEDQPTVAALLALPLTEEVEDIEEVEDTGNREVA